MSDRNVGYPFIFVYVLFWAGVAFLGFVLVTTNHAPTAPELEWRYPTPTTASGLQVSIARESVDLDRNQVHYIVSWTKNGEAVEGQDGKTIASELTSRGETWEVTVVPEDGTSGSFLCVLPWRECAGEINAKASITVGNSLPKARLSIEPAEITARDDVKVVAEGVDLDEDEVTFTYVWLEGEEVLEEGQEPKYATDTLPSKATKKGQTWRVIVTPNDGTDDGLPSEKSVTIN